MIRNMVTSLVEFERIRTTFAKAKALRRAADRVIAIAKKDNGRNTKLVYTQLRSFLLTDYATSRLMTDLSKRFYKRQGAFTRVVETLPRKSDGSRMAFIEYIDNKLEPLRVYSKEPPMLVNRNQSL